jgi:hypothetical protein
LSFPDEISLLLLGQSPAIGLFGDGKMPSVAHQTSLPFFFLHFLDRFLDLLSDLRFRLLDILLHFVFIDGYVDFVFLFVAASVGKAEPTTPESDAYKADDQDDEKFGN